MLTNRFRKHSVHLNISHKNLRKYDKTPLTKKPKKIMKQKPKIYETASAKDLF